MSHIQFKLGTDNSDFKKGLADAKAEADKSSSTIGGALGRIGIKAAAAGSAILLVGKALYDVAKAGYTEAAGLADLSTNLQVSTDALQSFDYAARQNGGNLEQVTKALEAVSLKSQDLIDGNEQMTAAFGKLGIKAKDFIGLGTDERLALIAKAFAEAKDRGQALAAVSDILGAKVGPKLLATLDEIGTKGLQGLIAGAKEAGQVIDADLIRRVDRFDDLLNRASKRAKGFGATVADAFIKAARYIANPATAGDEMAAEDEKAKATEATQKKLQKAAEQDRLKRAQQAAKDKAAQKRDLEDKKKLDDYIRARNSNDTETAKQAFDALTPEQRRNEAIRQRLELEKQMAALPRHQIDAETKREAIRKRILELTAEEKTANKEITAERQKQADKLKDIAEKLKAAIKKTQETKADLINAQFDPLRFSLQDAASGSRGSGRAKGNAGLIQSKEKQAQQILDRNNLQFGEDGSLQYVAAPGESPESVASKNKIAQTQTLPRLRALMGGAAQLRANTANLDRRDQDSAAAQRKAFREALDESKTLEAMKKSLEGKFLNQK